MCSVPYVPFGSYVELYIIFMRVDHWSISWLSADQAQSNTSIKCILTKFNFFFNSIITKSYRKDNVLSIIFCITNYKSFLLVIRIPPALTKKQEVEVLECCIHPVRISFGTRTERNIRISLQSHQTRREENSAQMGESTQTGIQYVQLLTSLSWELWTSEPTAAQQRKSLV